MADSLIHELRDGLPSSVDVFVMYGQTEASARLAYVPPSRLREKVGSIGIAIPGVELRVISENGASISPGQSGELIARGENIMLGYLDDPAATARVLRNGWLHTADLATVDDDGYIYVLGRMDDVIKSAGHRVSPEEVENVIQSHPSVAQCGVVGVKDRIQGEAIVAYVSSATSAGNLVDAIVTLCIERLPPYMRPKHIEVLDALPLNASLKLDRASLRQWAAKSFAGNTGM